MMVIVLVMKMIHYSAFDNMLLVILQNKVESTGETARERDSWRRILKRCSPQS
jgi:hypothetical protein